MALQIYFWKEERYKPLFQQELSMKPFLDSLTQRIEQEILQTGTIILCGKPCPRNALSDNPYAGLCGYAVEKLKELAPDLEVRTLRFSVLQPNRRTNHVVAEINVPEGTYIVDPTIRQFLPHAPFTYGPRDTYPLCIARETINKISTTRLPLTIF